MAPKKKTDEDAQKEAEEALRAKMAFFVGQETEQQIVMETVNFIFDNALAILQEKWYQDQTLELSANKAVEELGSLVSWMFVHRDEGELAPENDPSWAADEEAFPVPLDSWARGAVPVRKQQVPEGVMKKQGSVRSKRNGSLAPTKTMRTERTIEEEDGFTTVRSGSVVSATSKQAPKTARPYSPPSLVSAKDKEKKPQVLPVPEKPGSRFGEVRELDAEILRQVKILEQQRAHQAENQREEKEQRQKLEQLEKELKGKEFTYDAKGNIILINPLQPDRMPSQNVRLKIDLKSSLDEDDITPRKKTQSSSRATGGRRGGKKGRKKDENYEDFFKPSENAQPSILETMEMSSGVTLTKDGAAKEGPKIQSSGNSMRRSRQEHESMLQSGMGHMVSERVAPMPQADMQRALADAAPTPNFDIDESPIELEHVPKPEENDPNLALINSSEWGQNVKSLNGPYQPPPQPRKATPEVRVAAIGKTTFRQRNWVAGFEKPEMEFLPPPMYPAHQGHGFVSSYLASENPYTPTDMSDGEQSFKGGRLDSSLNHTGSPRSGHYPNQFTKTVAQEHVKPNNPRLASDLAA